MKKIVFLLLIGIYCKAQTSVIPYMPKQANFTDDYTAATWNLKSFSFDGTDNIFTGDAASSTILNNAIVGANKQFTLSMYVKKGINATTTVLFGRDNTTTSVRQLLVFFNTTNKLVFVLYTTSANSITWTSTASFAELREWNEFTFVYDGTQGTVTNRVTVYRNGILEAGSNVQAGTFTTINNTTANNIEIGARSTTAVFSTLKISQIALFNTNLSAANIAILHNNRVPFDITTNSTLNTNLVMYLVGDKSATFSTNWTWNDTKGSSVFTSTNMVSGDQVADAPALKQISVILQHGQSNASGRVPMSTLPSRLSGSKSWLKIWDGTNFVNINSSTNNNQYQDDVSANQYGIEFYLGDKLNRYYKKTIYIFKVVRGASYLANTTPSWSRQFLGVMFNQLSTDITAMKEWELANGFTITKLRFIWQQGEADSQLSTDATAYQAVWQLWLTGASNSVFSNKLMSIFYVQPKLYDTTLGSLQTSASLAFKSTINTAKSTTQATDVTNYRLYNTDGATVFADLVHFDDAGIRQIAEGVGNLIITDGL
jgi:hypothetical protein